MCKFPVSACGIFAGPVWVLRHHCRPRPPSGMALTGVDRRESCTVPISDQACPQDELLARGVQEVDFMNAHAAGQVGGLHTLSVINICIVAQWFVFRDVSICPSAVPKYFLGSRCALSASTSSSPASIQLIAENA